MDVKVRRWRIVLLNVDMHRGKTVAATQSRTFMSFNVQFLLKMNISVFKVTCSVQFSGQGRRLDDHWCVFQ